MKFFRLTGLDQCPITKQPTCPGCGGPVYRCDPNKNNVCNKRACGDPCCHTTRPEFSADGVPICPLIFQTQQQEGRDEDGGTGNADS